MQLWKAKELQVVCQLSPQAPITVFSFYFFSFSQEMLVPIPQRETLRMRLNWTHSVPWRLVLARVLRVRSDGPLKPP